MYLVSAVVYVDRAYLTWVFAADDLGLGSGIKEPKEEGTLNGITCYFSIFPIFIDITISSFCLYELLLIKLNINPRV